MDFQSVIAQGQALERAGQQAQAVQLYRQWLQAHPPSVQAGAVGFHLGVLLRRLQDTPGAVRAYTQALQWAPGLWQIAYNLGLAHEALGQGEQAVRVWAQALHTLQDQPQAQAQVLMQLGRFHEERDPERALEWLSQSLRLALDPGAAQHYLALRRRLCLWPVVPDWLQQTYPQQDFRLHMGPFMALAETDDPVLQGQISRSFLVTKARPPAPLPPAAPYTHKRLRIGYLSADFRWHAVSILMAEVFELHDRSRVEVFGFDYSDPTPSPMRQRVIQAFDHHVMLHKMTDEEAARHIRSLEMDVLIDLTGLTASSRWPILAYRPAPVQVNYLGFAGVSHIPGMTHILVDRVLMSEASVAVSPEKPIWLACYQANDRHRAIGPKQDRRSLGLPEDAVVYCAFNNSFKFTPEVWAVWMRVLRRVKNSVLWVLAEHDATRRELLRRAAEQGVSAERVVFANKVVPDLFLARMQCADVFLDTFPCGAGATASDALWAGLPVLTCPGRSYASRMAASLLTAMGLQELIAPSLDAYEEMAVALGTQSARRDALRQKVSRARTESRLFDTPAFVEDLENALWAVCRGPSAHSA